MCPFVSSITFFYDDSNNHDAVRSVLLLSGIGFHDDFSDYVSYDFSGTNLIGGIQPWIC